MNNYDLNLLWADMLGGSEFAFEQLYRQTITSLHRLAFRILRDQESSRDLLQEVFADLYLGRNKVAADSNIAGYLHSIVKYRALNLLRDQLREKARLTSFQQTALRMENEEGSDRQIADNHRIEKVVEQISFLPEKCRKVFELKYYNNLSYKQISSQLGISVKTVENHIAKAFSILRNKVSDEQLLFLLLSLNIWKYAVSAS